MSRRMDDHQFCQESSKKGLLRESLVISATATQESFWWVHFLVSPWGIRHSSLFLVYRCGNVPGTGFWRVASLRLWDPSSQESAFITRNSTKWIPFCLHWASDSSFLVYFPFPVAIWWVSAERIQEFQKQKQKKTKLGTPKVTMPLLPWYLIPGLSQRKSCWMADLLASSVLVGIWDTFAFLVFFLANALMSLR